MEYVYARKKIDKERIKNYIENGGNGKGNIHNYEKSVWTKSIFPYGDNWTSTDALDAVVTLDNGGYATMNAYFNNALQFQNAFYNSTLGTYITEDGLPHHERQRATRDESMKAVKMWVGDLVVMPDGISCYRAKALTMINAGAFYKTIVNYGQFKYWTNGNYPHQLTSIYINRCKTDGSLARQM
jgi:hypothetical protein